MAELILKDIRKKYFGVHSYTVDKMNLTISNHDFMIFVGPSGCGKSTVLRLIAGLEEITDGDLLIDNLRVNDLPGSKRDIAMVFQNYALYPHMTVEENMSFALQMKKLDKKIIQEKVKEAAQKLDLEHLLQRTPAQLSGGQRQRVAIGRAIVRDPKVFLMDEPLSNLDAKLRVKMRTEIAKLYNSFKDTTFIYVTHDQVEAMTMGSRIAVMYDGKIQQCDNPETIYEFPVNKFVAGFIGSPAMNFFDVTVVKEKDGVYLYRENMLKLKMPQDKEEKVISFKNKNVWLGIRPEHIYLKDNAYIKSAPDNTFKAKALVIEPLGAEKFVLFETNNFEFTARLDPKTNVKIYDEVEVVVDMNLSHVFDRNSELNITLDR